MSHFFTLVLIPGADGETPENEIARLLERYDENRAVPEYLEDCGCVGIKAQAEARGRWDADHPAWEAETESIKDELRDILTKALQETNGEVERPFTKFGEGVRVVIANWQATPRLRQLREQEKELAERLFAHYEERDGGIEALVKAHPLCGKPDPECDDHDENGQITTTYNPDSKWDWWQIGGRWTGALGDYDPDMDPANKRPCGLCGGTGTRQGMVVANGCNGCNGTGIETLWPTEWEPHETDVQPVRALLAKAREDQAEAKAAAQVGGEGASDTQVAVEPKLRLKEMPYALVTPDGEWHGQGRMGWFGMSSGDEDPEVWDDRVMELLEANEAAIAAVCDLHI